MHTLTDVLRAADQIIACPGTIPGHNGTYSFPGVRPHGHAGRCNRVYRTGGPCEACRCESHVGTACTSVSCGSAPCSEGMTFAEWSAKHFPNHPRAEDE